MGGGGVCRAGPGELGWGGLGQAGLGIIVFEETIYDCPSHYLFYVFAFQIMTLRLHICICRPAKVQYMITE